jgi:hypothetical protein
MWITIRTKRISLAPQARRNIEAYVFRSLRRERRQIASCVVTIAPVKLGGEMGFTSRIRLWSAYLGSIGVRDVGNTIRTAVQQAALRTRQVVRRRLHKRRAQSRRLGRGRLSRWPQGLSADYTSVAREKT